ncbi:uncharacterized protein KY384_005841 [Bacidia gigantensis]|uniref:uncharacterized protein n=1 Tax=Bacidia gigantensis TaxID=2732470 RepID=UPI001D058FBC|nr:uncharacterized protein KY384_005841 [Bacidia gigantensis]KAG8529206.1 hypothetical protein KY384_005841 [Bacidia gigantensis]
MASVRSLGVHIPSALPFLVAEGILPSDPSRASYKWEANSHDEVGKGFVREELLTTAYCVVWSRGGIIERVFRFEAENEIVTQAAFTEFPSHPPSENIRRERQTDGKKVGDLLSGEDSKTKGRRPKGRDPWAKQDGYTQVEAGRSSHGKHLERQPACRALVIVLKTQAHVYLISKTSHVVYLPFEVDSIFPAYRGVLLQRKVVEHLEPQHTPRLPTVPQNTFSLSQSTAVTKSFGPSGDGDGLQDPLAPLLAGLRTVDSIPGSPELPRLFCLSDTMTQLGAVVTDSTAGSRKTLSPQAAIGTAFVNLDSNEKLLYVTKEDEFSRHNSLTAHAPAFAIAVTENAKDDTTTVWAMTYSIGDNDHALRSQSFRSFSGNVSRRRSSFNSRLSTGANTPVASTHRQPSRELSLEDQSLQRQPELLESVLENPANPAKSSRRVSSLLARADLSTKQDKDTFTDLMAGTHGSRTSRRGASFGPRLYEINQDYEKTSKFSKSHPLLEITSSIDSVSLQSQPLDDRLEAVDDGGDMNAGGSSATGKHRLKNEIIFKKISRLQSPQSRGVQTMDNLTLSDTHVFTLQSPGPFFNNYGAKNILVCVMRRRLGELLIVHVKATDRGKSKKIDHLDLPDVRNYECSVTGTRRSGIRDACRISHRNHDWILVLDAKGGLSLQAPWSSMFKIDISEPLNLHDPHKISPQHPRQRADESGSNRRTSQTIKAIVALEQADRQGGVDVVSEKGEKHRITIELAPSSWFVARIIKICQTVLPSTETDGDSILRGWWDVMAWLKRREESTIDEEWTGLLVLLCSFAVPFLDKPQLETTPRQKRRKGGLLRSSSGANTDQESWHEMMRQESASSKTCPDWMRGGAWQWTRAEEPVARSLAQSTGTFSSNLSAGAAKSLPKSSYMSDCIALARDFANSIQGQLASGQQGYSPVAASRDSRARQMALPSILIALHLYREELKLDTTSTSHMHRLAPILAQIGSWIGWPDWSSKVSAYYMLESVDMRDWQFDGSIMTGIKSPSQPYPPPSILKHLESAASIDQVSKFPTLIDAIASFSLKQEGHEELVQSILMDLTPRTLLVTNLLGSQGQPIDLQIRNMATSGINFSVLETLPESVAVYFRAVLSACQINPSALSDTATLQLVEREDIAMLGKASEKTRSKGRILYTPSENPMRDVHIICSQASDVENIGPYDGSAEIDRQSITRYLFNEDQRFAEAAKLVHPLQNPIAQCVPEPGWAESDLLETQQELAKVVALRTLSVSLGRSLLFYSARMPLITEKYPIHGFTLSCTMKPSDTTVTADRTAFTEEKVSWAFFHAGVEAGLSISREAQGIDTSWILFNKPRDLTHRHAGFLFALGLNGHLRSLAKWVAFKYLTPKHNMTSIGLLLGLSVSYLGSMDTVITRLLSIHVTRMLPPGAAELNLSPLTQTCGIMGIGLLYCDSQHRRMSEILLSELENMEVEEALNPMEILRDEGYRLSAGFALGLINLGKGGT